MMDLLIRNVPVHLMDTLRSRARERGRSIQIEALDALQHGIEPIGHSIVEYLRTVAPAQADVDISAGLNVIRQMRDER